MTWSKSQGVPHSSKAVSLRPTNRRDLRPFALITVLWLIAGMATAQIIRAGLGQVPQTDPRINPNSAEWWQLTSLPTIGEGRAKAIVAYRNEWTTADGPVFTQAADLEKVRGIGPKTVQRIERHLRFDE